MSGMDLIARELHTLTELSEKLAAVEVWRQTYGLMDTAFPHLPPPPVPGVPEMKDLSLRILRVQMDRAERVEARLKATSYGLQQSMQEVVDLREEVAKGKARVAELEATMEVMRNNWVPGPQVIARELAASKEERERCAKAATAFLWKWLNKEVYKGNSGLYPAAHSVLEALESKP